MQRDRLRVLQSAFKYGVENVHTFRGSEVKAKEQALAVHDNLNLLFVPCKAVHSNKCLDTPLMLTSTESSGEVDSKPWSGKIAAGTAPWEKAGT